MWCLDLNLRGNTVKRGRNGKGTGFKTSTETVGELIPRPAVEGPNIRNVAPCKHLGVFHQECYAIY